VGQGSVIKGWDEALVTFSVGERAFLYLSPSFAYGASGAGNSIPPNSPLIFDVELLSID